MRLSYQLGVVTLITLLLPWSGCQLMREVEQALRQEQQQALLERAELLARSLRDQALPEAPPASLLAPLYVQPQSIPFQLDGYGDEWLATPVRLAGSDLSVQLAQNRLGQHYLRVFGPAKEWRADQGLLLAYEQRGQRRLTWLPLGRPGLLGQELRQWQGGRWQPQRLGPRGAWQLGPVQWSLELAVPKIDALALTWVQPEPGGYRFSGSWSAGPTPAALASQLDQLPLHPVVAQSTALSQRLAELEPELRVRIIDGAGFVRARSGLLLFPPLAEQTLAQGLFRGLYGFVLDQRWGLAESPQLQSGRLQADWLQGRGTLWYQAPRDPLTVAAWVPLGSGWLLLEKSSEAVLSLNSQVWLRLLQLFGSSSLVVLLVLWGYAFWLSWRVQALHRQMRRFHPEEAESIARASAMPDELGDLSRALVRLQDQVGEYTRYLQTLAAKLAHELRTPLAVIHSSLDNLEAEGVDANAEVYLQRAREGGQRLGTLLGAMSAAHHLEQAIAQSEPEWFELDQLLQSMTDVYRGLYPELELVAEIEPADYRCFGDPALLVQLLDKLVNNAADFTPEGGIIALGLHCRGAQWCLQVDNEGPLLPEAMREQLFQSLVSVRADGSRGHLGLGLYLVRLIIEAFGGRVSAANRSDGRGVQFSCWLPAGGLAVEQKDIRHEVDNRRGSAR